MVERLSSWGQRLDGAKLRRPLAFAASALYGLKTGGRQRFSVDEHGRWVNRQVEATIVSPTIHTAFFEAFRDQVMENWAWQYRPVLDDVIIDVGAGVGEEAIVFSKLVGPGGKVISVEAHPDTFSCLEETISRSKLASVVPVACAIADQDGVVHIGEHDNHLANSIMGSASNAHPIPARSLDSLADELNLKEVALLKMNIEGAERLAVRGMTELTKRLRHVVISCHDFIDDRDGGDQFKTFVDVREQLERLGFEITTRPNHPDNWVRYYLYGKNRALA